MSTTQGTNPEQDNLRSAMARYRVASEEFWRANATIKGAYEANPSHRVMFLQAAVEHDAARQELEQAASAALGFPLAELLETLRGRPKPGRRG